MADTYIVTGILTDGRTVTLDSVLPLATGKVRVVVEQLTNDTKRSCHDVLEEIHARQNARGHQPPSRNEVDTYLKAERESWDA